MELISIHRAPAGQKQSHIANGITFNLVIGILLTVATIFGTAWWMAAQHDKQAEISLQRMVVGGVDLTRRRLEAITNDYGWWEEAYLAYDRGDSEWMDANIGTGITGTRIADALAVVSAEGAVKTAWTIDEAPDAWKSIYTPDLVARTRTLIADSKVDNLAAKSMFFRVGEKVYLISVQRIVPVSKADVVKGTDLPLVVFAQEMTRDRLLDLGQQYLISDLRLVLSLPQVIPTGTGTEVLEDADGKTIGYLQWASPRPGRQLLEKLALPMAGAVLAFVFVATFVSMRVRRIALALSKSEQEAIVASQTDKQTALLNRAGFGALISTPECVEYCRLGQVALVYIDVNDFKSINDSFGHHCGDMVIVELARRLEIALAGYGHLARVGGDEFVAVLYGPDVLQIASRLLERLYEVLAAPFAIGTHIQHVHCAIGYAVSQRGSTDVDETLRRADVAMYHAKIANVRDGVVFDLSMEAATEERRRVEDILRHALAHDELEVVYQPILHLSTDRIVRSEVLVRLRSAQHGSIRPDVFIPVAEKTGLIEEVGTFVLERTCRDMTKYPQLNVSVNVSPVQLRDPGFVEMLLRIVKKHGIDPSRLQLELTEGVLVAAPTIAEQRLRMLKELGFSLALDDFGTGFSSIGYLRQFPFNCLKIDQSFITNLGRNVRDAALVHSLVSLCKAMDMDVTAEGVETEEQRLILRATGCTNIQGYFISRPVPVKEVVEFVNKWHNRISAIVEPQARIIGGHLSAIR